jgi:TRAP-type C4-dicarboxylate transport system permease small subunit
MAVLSALSVVLMLVLIIGDVTSRTLGFGSWVVTLPVTEVALLYFTVLSAPYLVRQKAHVAVDSFIALAPPALRRVATWLVIAGCVAASGLIAVISVDMLTEALRTGEMVMGGIDFPFWVIALPMPLSYLLVATEFLRMGLRGETPFRDGVGESL